MARQPKCPVNRPGRSRAGPAGSDRGIGSCGRNLAGCASGLVFGVGATAMAAPTSRRSRVPSASKGKLSLDEAAHAVGLAFRPGDPGAGSGSPEPRSPAMVWVSRRALLITSTIATSSPGRMSAASNTSTSTVTEPTWCRSACMTVPRWIFYLKILRVMRCVQMTSPFGGFVDAGRVMAGYSGGSEKTAGRSVWPNEPTSRSVEAPDYLVVQPATAGDVRAARMETLRLHNGGVREVDRLT